jgi:hypothetical protein
MLNARRKLFKSLLPVSFLMLFLSKKSKADNSILNQQSEQKMPEEISNEGNYNLLFHNIKKNILSFLGASDGYKYLGICPDVEQLRSIEPTVQNQRIIVRSYYSRKLKSAVYAQDLGGGEFYYDSTDNTSIDDGGMVIVTANGARWKRPIFNQIDVAWYGIIPEEDCTKQIDNCFGFAMNENVFYKKINNNINDLELNGFPIVWGLGEYIYSGLGFIRNPGSKLAKSIFMTGQGKTKTVIHIKSEIFFISMPDCNELKLSHITFVGGKGIFRIFGNTPVVRQNFSISDCVFSNQSQCCISSNSPDMPNFKITNCKFIDKSNLSIAISCIGLTDSFNISNNEFFGFKYKIKLGRGGNNAWIYQNFFAGAKEDCADIWLVPSEKINNSGQGLRITSNKFGNELIDDNAVRILICFYKNKDDPQEGYLSLPDINNINYGYLSGIDISDNLFNGVEGMKKGVIYSYTNKIGGMRWRNNYMGGGVNPYIIEFDSRIKELCESGDCSPNFFTADVNDSSKKGITQFVSNLSGLGFISDDNQFFSDSLTGEIVNEMFPFYHGVLFEWNDKFFERDNPSNGLYKDKNNHLFLVDHIQAPIIGKKGWIEIVLSKVDANLHADMLDVNLIQQNQHSINNIIMRTIFISNSARLYRISFNIQDASKPLCLLINSHAGENISSEQISINSIIIYQSEYPLINYNQNYPHFYNKNSSDDIKYITLGDYSLWVDDKGLLRGVFGVPTNKDSGTLISNSIISK